MTPSSSSPSAIRSDDEILLDDTTNLVDGAKALHESMTIAADATTAIMKRMISIIIDASPLCYNTTVVYDVCGKDLRLW